MNGKRIIPVNKENNILIIDQTLILFSYFLSHSSIIINSINKIFGCGKCLSERGPNGGVKSKEKE